MFCKMLKFCFIGNKLFFCWYVYSHEAWISNWWWSYSNVYLGKKSFHTFIILTFTVRIIMQNSVTDKCNIKLFYRIFSNSIWEIKQTIKFLSLNNGQKIILENHVVNKNVNIQSELLLEFIYNQRILSEWLCTKLQSVLDKNFKMAATFEGGFFL